MPRYHDYGMEYLACFDPTRSIQEQTCRLFFYSRDEGPLRTSALSENRYIMEYSLFFLVTSDGGAERVRRSIIGITSKSFAYTKLNFVQATSSTLPTKLIVTTNSIL
jgi:hypothetical protein